MSAPNLKLVPSNLDDLWAQADAAREKKEAEASCDLRAVMAGTATAPTALHVVAPPAPEAPAAPAEQPAAQVVELLTPPAPEAKPARPAAPRKPSAADVLIRLAKEHKFDPFPAADGTLAAEVEIDGETVALPVDADEFSACLRTWHLEETGCSVSDSQIRQALKTLTADFQTKALLAPPPAPVAAPDAEIDPVDAAKAAQALGELLAFIPRLRPAAGNERVAALLERRKIPAYLVTELDLAGAIPAIGATDEAPIFAVGGATEDGGPGSWWATLHLLIVPMYNVSGVVACARARYVGTGAIEAAKKSLGPKHIKAVGTWFCCPIWLAYLRGERPAPKILIVTEGEMDFLAVVCALRLLGRKDVGVCGIVAGSWTPELADKVPPGTKVAILTHSDSKGCGYRDDIARSLGKLRPLFVRHLFNTGKQKSPDENDRLCDGYDPTADLHEFKAPPAMWRRSDSGNAERLLHHHGGDLRYVMGPKTEFWTAWDGTRWVTGLPAAAEAEIRCLETIRGILDTESHATPEEAEALAMWAERSENRVSIESAVSRARVVKAIRLHPDQLDADKWTLGVKNGVVDLRAGRLLAGHGRDLYITRQAGAAFDPDAKCPLYEKTLLEIFEGNVELISFLQRFCGYCLTGVTSEKRLTFFLGNGDNGKSMLLELWLRVLGEYGCAPDASLFIDRVKGQHTTDLNDLVGMRMALISEIETGAQLSVGIAKKLAGGTDRLTARGMRENNRTSPVTAKIGAALNDLPKIPAKDRAAWKRILLVSFNRKFLLHEQDPDLVDKLTAELDGILAWFVRGCLEWQRVKLSPPDCVLARSAEAQAEGDQVGRFLDDACELGQALEATSTELYAAFQTWLTRSGEKSDLSQIQLGQELAGRGFADVFVGPKKKRRRAWRGLQVAMVEPTAKHDDRAALLDSLIPEIPG